MTWIELILREKEKKMKIQMRDRRVRRESLAKCSHKIVTVASSCSMDEAIGAFVD